MINEGEVFMDAEDIKNEQENNTSNGVDEETLAIAMAIKKAKEDPQVASLFRQVVGVENTQPAQQQPQAAPQVTPEEQQLESVRKEIAQIEERLRSTSPESDDYAQLMNRLALLRLDEARLEPTVRIQREMAPLRENQARTALYQLSMVARQRVESDPVLSQNPTAKQVALQKVEQSLNELFRQAPDQLLSPQVNEFIEAIVRGVAYEYMLPKPPHDPGMNAQGTGGGTVVPKEIEALASKFGLDPKEVAQLAQQEAERMRAEMMEKIGKGVI